MPQNRMWIGLFAVCLLYGCAGPQAVETIDTDLSSAQSAFGELEQLELELSTAYSTDCGRACELRAEICRLSLMICDISWRNPQDPDLEEMCFDASQRCEVATTEVASRCECSGAEKLYVRKRQKLPVTLHRFPIDFRFLSLSCLST